MIDLLMAVLGISGGIMFGVILLLISQVYQLRELSELKRKSEDDSVDQEA